MTNHEPKHPTADMAGLDGLIERLQMTYRKEYSPTGSSVGDISNRLRPAPILASELLFNPDGPAAVRQLQALAHRVKVLEAENERLRKALTQTLLHRYAEWCGIPLAAFEEAKP